MLRVILVLVWLAGGVTVLLRYLVDRKDGKSFTGPRFWLYVAGVLTFIVAGTGLYLTLKQQDRSADRGMTAPQVRMLKQRLSRRTTGDRATIELVARLGDVEATRFAEQLERVFLDSGWTVTPMAFPVGPLPPGLSIMLRGGSRDQAPPGTTQVVRALDEAGLATKMFQSPTMQERFPNAIHIVVGPKP